ncbi:MAG: autotransporter domain-containing protein [Parvibaculum sp.]|nr:autotransporter domain-containing protein [Parvibaculum sp.]
MSFSFSLRTKLLGTSSLAAGAFMFGAGILGASPAYAACSGGPVANNAVITCTGPGNTPVTGTADDVSVTIAAGADISGTGGPAVQLVGDRNTITLNPTSLATSTGSDYYGTIDTYGDDATLIINGGDVRATSTGESTPAILLDGDNVTFTFSAASGGSSVELETAGTDAESYAGLVVHSRNHTITLNADTHISVSGYGGLGTDYNGMDVINYATDTDERGTITFEDHASVTVNVAAATTNANIYGILEIGDGPGPLAYASDIEFNDGFVLVTAQDAATGTIVGTMQRGDFGTITLNGGANVRVYGTGGSSDYAGIGQFGDYTSVILNGTSFVRVNADGGVASYVSGIGAGGDYVNITLNDSANVTLNFVEAQDAIGVVMNSAYGQLTLNGNSSVTMNGYANSGGAGVAVYGLGNEVALNDYATIDTTNAEMGPRGMVGLLLGGNIDSTITLNGQAQILAADAPAIVMAGGFYNSVFLGENAYLSGYNGLYVSDTFDTITINGTVVGTGGTAIDMNGGFSNTVILNSATIIGSIEGGGSGNGDSLVLQGAGTLIDNVLGFDELTVNATGTWTLGTLTSTFADTVTINSGKLVAIGNLYASSGITIEQGATLGGTGLIEGDITNYGTLAPGQSPGVMNVVGSVTMAAGSVFDVEIAGGLADQLNVSGAPGTVTIDPGAILQATFTGGTDGFAGDILTATGGITGAFAFAGAGVLDYSNPNVLTLVSTSSSSLNGAMSAGASQGFLFLDTVLGQASRSAGTGQTLWATTLSDRSDRAGDGLSRGFESRNTGGAFGGDIWQSGEMKFGLAGGYLDGKATTAGGGSRSTIDGYHAAAYGSYKTGSTWATGALTAAYQDQSVSRNVLAGGVLLTARGAPEAWSGGAGLGIGHDLPLNGAFTLTPQAGVTYQHVERDGFSETGGGAGAFALDGIASDTMRARAGAELSLNIADPDATWKVRPAINAALVQEWRGGDATATGRFVASGARFTAALDQRDQSYLALGAGVDVGVGYGVTAFVSYDGGVGGDVETSGGVRGGFRFEW